MSDAALFPSTPILTWLDGETLFSLVSRYHFLSGHRLPRYTSLALFGSSRGGYQHDFTSHLDEFANRTGLLLGSAEQICRGRTMLRFYKTFMSTDDEERSVQVQLGSSVSGLKYRMGIQTSRFRAHHPLKACLTCMAADRRYVGWAYWHLDHQFPGVWICVKHKEPLMESTVKVNGVGRFLWHLPREEYLRFPNAEQVQPGATALVALTRLANLIKALTNASGNLRIDMTLLPAIYRVKLRERNLITAGGSYRLSSIAVEFAEYSRAFRSILELRGLPETTVESYQQLSRYLRAPRCGTHPLRHLVLIDWLFESPEDFLLAYGADAKLRGHEGDCGVAKSDALQGNGEAKRQLREALEKGERSLTAIANDIGIDTATAMAWSASLGFSVRRRPKKLLPKVRSELIACLRGGMDKGVAAEKFRISTVTVTSVLRTEVALHAMWLQIRAEQRLSTARAEWQKLLTAHRGIGIKFIRSIDPALYAWLYRNDRNWLTENLPARAMRKVAGTSRISWDSRDDELCAAVEKASLKIATSLNGKKLRLCHLLQEIPELRAKQSALRKLPRTVRALEIALKRANRPLSF